MNEIIKITDALNRIALAIERQTITMCRIEASLDNIKARIGR